MTIKLYTATNYAGLVALEAGVGSILLSSVKVGSIRVPAGLNVSLTTSTGINLKLAKDAPNIGTNTFVKSVIVYAPAPTFSPTSLPSPEPSLTPTVSPTSSAAVLYSKCNYGGFMYEFFGGNSINIPAAQTVGSVQLTGGMQIALKGNDGSVTLIRSSNPCLQLPTPIVSIRLYTSDSPTATPSQLPTTVSPTSAAPTAQPSYPTIQPSVPTIIPTASPTIGTSCPFGYTSTSTYCLQFFPVAKTWIDASKDCSGRSSGRLVSVTSVRKNGVVRLLVSASGASWIDVPKEVLAKFVYSSNESTAGYSNWAQVPVSVGITGQKVGSRVLISGTNGTWSLQSNSSLSAYVCETTGRLFTKANVSAKLIHRFSFREDPSGARDSIGNATATLHSGALLSNGQLILRWNGGANPKPYVLLSPGVLSPVDTVTIELWASFDNTHPSNAAIFSFGDVHNNITFSGNLAGLTDVHIVVVYNPPMGYTKFYAEGYLQAVNKLSLGAPLVGALGASEPFNFIGRNRLNTAPGMQAAISEFRIYTGELTKKQVYNNFLIGVDPSHVSLSSKLTLRDVRITYYATSIQSILVGFFGGITVQAQMFGLESRFTFSATDPQCGYRVTLPVNPMTSNIQASLAAMNYTVSYTSHPQAPSFITDAYTYCDASLDPFSYLDSTGTLSQNLSYAYVDVTDHYSVTFLYRSGMCYRAGGTEPFAVVEPVPQYSGLTCYKSNDTFFNPGDNRTIKFTLLEYYPQDPSWGSRPFGLCQTPVPEFYVNGSTITILDLISGRSNTQEFDYNTTFVHHPNGQALFPQGFEYEINAAGPRPSPPFDLTFDVTVARKIDGPAVPYFSTVQMTFFVPIIGSLPNEVPSVLPVTSDPTIIFLVLRDPPGGSSKCSIAQGTTLETALSISGTQVSVSTLSVESKGSIFVDQKMEVVTAPLGVGTMANGDVISEYFSGKITTVLEVASSWTTTSGYVYSMTFHSEFGTSDDPFIAGHPSDVIFGGGVDLFVSEAVEVYVNRTTKLLSCLNVKNTYIWRPGQITTYMLKVIDIVDTTARLSTIRDSERQNGNFAIAGKLEKQITNWEAVLRNYRAHNSDLTALFTADEIRLNAAVNEYGSFFQLMQAGYLTLSIVQSVIAIIGNIVNVASMFTKATPQAAGGVVMAVFLRTVVDVLMTIFGGLLTQCSFVAPAVSSPMLNHACNDFDSGKWQSVVDVVNGVCTMPVLDSDADGQVDDFKSKYCMQGSVGANGVEGGLAGDGSVSMYGFLRDHNKLLTFSAGTDVTLTWSSLVRTSRSFDTEFEFKFTESNHVDSSSTFLAVVAGDHGEVDIGLQTQRNINVGKGTDQAHEYEREVTVSLGDGDDGDYFAIRITEDPVYGTPVFTTMGGASKCPGETATSRRDSGVTLKAVVPRCGIKRNLPCGLSTLNVQQPARFGVIIENLSPTKDKVWYTLRLSSQYDTYYVNGYLNNYGLGSCGTPGLRAGIIVVFSESDLRNIPYNLWIEVPFTALTSSTGSVDDCYKFVGVRVEIVATCDMSTSNGAPYQYGVVVNPDTGVVALSYEEVDVIREEVSGASFSVEWPRSSAVDGIRRLEISAKGTEQSAVAMNDMAALATEMQAMKRELMTVMVGFLSFLTIVVIWAGLYAASMLHDIGVERQIKVVV